MQGSFLTNYPWIKNYLVYPNYAILLHNCQVAVAHTPFQFITLCYQTHRSPG
jgi:hypothetical protein